MTKLPETLYHYTSLDTLALILTNKTISFNTLLNVDDIEEAETSDLGLFGKFVYVSCWTDDAAESIAMWQMYTPNMHGVRIQMPSFPFKRHHYKAGTYHFKEDVSTFINEKSVYEENKASIVTDLPKLIPVTYTTDDTLIHPVVRQGATLAECSDLINRKLAGNQNRNVNYDLSKLGKYKNDVWSFQKEWRYWISMSPWGLQEAENATMQKHIEFAKRLEDPMTKPPYERFFLELSDEAVARMEVVFGPRMTEAEKILAKHLLRGCGLDGKWRDSSLKIR